MSTSTAASERPERSRNAKAQARHRAKRKAYIDQLEQTVTKLQTVLGYTPDDVANLPPPAVKIRELEQELASVKRENEDLRRMLADSGNRILPVDLSRRASSLNNGYVDRANSDRDFKRRKIPGVEDMYMTPDSSHEILSRPPPLTIPQPVSHHYTSLSSTPSSNNSGSNSSLFTLHAPAFQLPNTPSGSSSTSSPPFSPATMQAPPSASPRTSLAGSHHLPVSGYSHQNGGGHYASAVKVEDDGYSTSHHHPSTSSNHYSPPPFARTTSDTGMNSWQTPSYSSERILFR